MDLVVSGPTFLDVTLAGLQATVHPGREVFAQDAALGPGGAAIAAIAASRLGLQTALHSDLGADAAGLLCRDVLMTEAVDVSAAPLLDGWRTPLTVCISDRDDRAMATFQEPPPRRRTPPVAARALLANLRDVAARARTDGTVVVADIGWDASGRWDDGDLAPLRSCDVFLPNSVEAMAYTRTATPREAARALGDRVERVIVTCGAEGVIALDAGAGSESLIPAIPVDAVDTTGAGDVLGAGVVAGLLRGWQFADVAAFGALCAGLAVTRLGSATASPTLAGIDEWWRAARADAALSSRYAFLEGLHDAEAGLPSQEPTG
ncbi:carbohydrate kinase family protein [Microbacterium gilvum]|uniref:PfkB family carbohydrate kinase n=1 Tax=Microbacterium gilvum TaxID=1336204 RepID=A0ABP8ZWS1_9MICO